MARREISISCTAPQKMTPRIRDKPRAELSGEDLAGRIRAWAGELGFQQVGITDCEVSEAELRLQDWLARGWQGDMEYLWARGKEATRRAELAPGTLRVITVRLNYFPADAAVSWDVRAEVSRG